MGQSRKDDNALLWGIGGLGAAYLLTRGFEQWPEGFEGVSNFLDFEWPDLSWPWEQEGLTWPWENITMPWEGLTGKIEEGMQGLMQGALAFGEPLTETGLRAGLVGGRVLTGKAILKSRVPTKMATKAGEVTARILAKRFEPVIQTAPKLLKTMPHGVAASRIALKGEGFLLKPTTLAVTKTAGKTAVKAGAKVVPRVAAKAIPVVGWGLLLVDVGADIARLFGADVTEWLGLSAIAEPFLGYNPLEQAVKESGGGSLAPVSAGIGISSLVSSILGRFR